MIGALRYQASLADRVPTTIINGLTTLLKRRTSPQLHLLIWGVAVDREGVAGTVWVLHDLVKSTSNWLAMAWEVDDPPIEAGTDAHPCI